jgi:Peptidase A4 family
MKTVSPRELAARAAIVAALVAALSAAAAPSDAQVPFAHVVPTNFPGVFAFTQPPAGFDPLAASQEELVAWGYPPRPGSGEGPKARARWSQEVSTPLRRVVPQLVRREGVYNRPLTGLKVTSPPSVFNAIAGTSFDWSGYILAPASGAQPFYSVTGRLTVPSVKQAPGTCSGGWDYSTEWVGIGGAFDSYLLQAGSAANVFCDVGNNIPEYFPWIEWMPGAELVLYKNASTNTLYPFAPGDYLIVTVWATNFTSGVSTSGNLSFADVTQGWTASLTFTAASLGGSEVTGQSAEWIVERTEVGGAFATLPDYVANPWWFTKALDLGAGAHYSGSPGGSTAYNLTMLDSSSAPVSYVELFGRDALWFFPEGSATK